jgi:predicted aspartyl protease
MQLVLRNSLPFVTVALTHRGSTMSIADVLVDTGSASTVLSADAAAQLSIFPEPTDRLRTLRGIGGRELVFTRRLERIEVDGHGLDGFEVEIGGMDYGFAINGILGMDFLLGSRAIVSLADLTMMF